ncbi:MAG: hypothetical protein V3V15_06650 [Sphingorhabdus sp.]
MKFHHTIFCALLLVGLTCCTSVRFKTDNQAQFISGQVSHIIDGDTFRLAGHLKRIRLFGIDAPEIGEKGHAQSNEALPMNGAGIQKANTERVIK